MKPVATLTFVSELFVGDKFTLATESGLKIYRLLPDTNLAENIETKEIVKVYRYNRVWKMEEI